MPDPVVAPEVSQTPAPEAAPAPETAAPSDTMEDNLGSIYDSLMETSGENPEAGGDEPLQEEVKAPPEVEPPSSAPAHLPQGIKEGWGELDPAMQEAIKAYDSKQNKQFAKLGEDLGRARPIAEVLQGLVDDHPSFKGRTPEQLAQGAAQLAAVQVHLEKNPLKGVMDIAQSYGVLDQLKQAFAAQPATEEVTVASLQQQIAALQQQIRNPGIAPDVDKLVDTRLNERSAEQEIADFAETREHFDTVEADLPSCIEVVTRHHPEYNNLQKLEAAYNLAVNAVPGLRVDAQDEPAPAVLNGADKTEKLKSKRNVKAIQAAAANVASNPGNGTPSETQEQATGAVWDRLMK